MPKKKREPCVKKERGLFDERDMRREKERVSTEMKSKRDQKRKSIITVIFYMTCLGGEEEGTRKKNENMKKRRKMKKNEKMKKNI